MKTAKKGIRAIKKACREMAHEMMLLEYRKYDDIWWNRIRITPELILCADAQGAADLLGDDDAAEIVDPSHNSGCFHAVLPPVLVFLL